MPHKHTRGSKDADSSTYDLPPAILAEPLAVGKTAKSKARNEQALNSKRRAKKAKRTDDTPRAFVRLLEHAQGKKRRSGLDDGDEPPGKKLKRKRGGEGDAQDNGAVLAPQKLKIMPGERLSDFAARVDQSMPITGISRKGKKVPGMRERQTRQERKIQKMHREWRVEEVRLKEKEQDALDIAEAEDAEKWTVGSGIVHTGEMSSLQKKSKGKRRRGGKDDDDPWAVLKEKRAKPKGVFDVAQAPPELRNPAGAKFKMRNGAKVKVANVPNAAGSLKRREQLSEARQGIIESYRRLMAATKKQKRNET